jgi:hypothetical protein
VTWVALLGAALTTLAAALRPRPLPTHPYIDNPFGVWITGGGFTTSNLYAALSLLGMTLLLVSTLAALFSLIVRLRRARGGAQA